MTPDERDRLTRVEEQVKAQAEAVREIRASVASIATSVQKLADAFGTATAFGKGSLWTITKITAGLLAAAAVVDWIARHFPFRQ